ncbi:hypothetical protein MKW94_030250 [Papaver nudicaule]|uniref:Transposase n=1 Tax=Papaver nudicaule TaxID=74823 RepID=A0AA41W1J9_PAPNU|nr:hypothetical protein [Papaver nudicaule]
MANNNEQAPTSSSDASTQRNVRGLTRGLLLDALINAGGKLPIKFCEFERVPVCSNASHLASECGVIVRSLAPLRYKSWTKIPRVERNSMIERVKNKFIVDTSLPMVVEFLDKSMGKKYASRRTKMSSHFNSLVNAEGATVEDAKKKPYKNVTEDDWIWLCDNVFNTTAFKKRSAAGKKAREAVPYNHRGGSKSHAVHVEARRKSGVVQAEIGTFYDIHTYTTTKSDGTTEVVWISDEARIRWDKINELLQLGTEEGATPLTEAQVCAQALKKKRKRRCASSDVDFNGGELHEMIQKQADQLLAQQEQILEQNQMIKKLQDMISEQQNVFRRFASVNVSSAQATTNGETTASVNVSSAQATTNGETTVN